MPTYPQTAGFVPGPGGAKVAFDISAATQITTGRGTVWRVFVNTAPTAAGGVYDTANGTADASTLICAIPTTAGPVEIIAPIYSGLYVSPGTGGVVSVIHGL